jgi:2-polyprenyl-3-methyl-5-hydroxy-6-metoxy-1,4-benzoquinol methylase
MNLIERIKNNPAYNFTNGVYYITQQVTDNPSEEIYLKTRKKEGRLYDDSIVKNLPEFPLEHRYYTEWRVRKLSSQKLVNYLSNIKGEKDILDLGCGNGWLSNMLSDIDNSNVLGMDLNTAELEQASKVFLPKNNLLFAYADIFNITLNEYKFDFIILAAMIQYFRDISSLLENLLGKLKDEGEIHIIDSPLYSEKEVSKARERSASYYAELGVPEMKEYYNHHTLREILANFNAEIFYNPNSSMNRIKRSLSKSYSPLYWIRIKK